jgi:hypothetical protein
VETTQSCVPTRTRAARPSAKMNITLCLEAGVGVVPSFLCLLQCDCRVGWQ